MTITNFNMHQKTRKKVYILSIYGVQDLVYSTIKEARQAYKRAISIYNDVELCKYHWSEYLELYIYDETLDSHSLTGETEVLV